MIMVNMIVIKMNQTTIIKRMDTSKEKERKKKKEKEGGMKDSI